ncbi:probable rRNA-processing protein EBP2 homolog [Macrosteles quadrilineatus]|uniref:probable rRNA-processing protein EBP2 homolog n=1 Tax=Macrosteles quadrilineatus TaxID=74068 RepID=UPI0023E1293D|nr:probable rRNA-processing protein EBP2 homolog [Macrosteles quadrilineatus]
MSLPSSDDYDSEGTDYGELSVMRDMHNELNQESPVPTASDCSSEFSDSDSELQHAFAKGLLKPGLNVRLMEKKKVFINDVAGLRQKLQEIKKDLNWFERLDLVCKPAPLAPEIAVQIEEQETQSLSSGKNLALNEFKRETTFHRQAQAAVLEGLARLKALGVVTKRPEDYFAEMAKTDVHMQKVRALLTKKQAETERIEKIRNIRQQRKISKQLQKEGKLKKQNEKKEMLDEVKKFRKGIRKDLDFLENKKPQKQNPKKGPTKSQMKRQYKDSKFGFGGKKRGLKANTKESSASMDDYNKPSRRKGPKMMKPGKKSAKNFRPGKSKRIKMKGQGRRKN